MVSYINNFNQIREKIIHSNDEFSGELGEISDVKPVLSCTGHFAHRTDMDGGGGQRLDKNLPIAFAEYPAVEDCHDTTVGLCADRPSKALPEA